MSTAVLEPRQAQPGLFDPLSPVPLPTPTSALTPSLSSILFDDLIPSTIPADDSEAPAAVPFTIDDLSKASWAASRILDAQARIAQRAELASLYRSKLDQWLSDSCAQDESSISFLSHLLQPFVEAELAQSHSRSRTLRLPTATASLRKGQDRLCILDEAAALAFLEVQHPTAVVVKKTISLSTVRSLILTKGEPVPGIQAELGRDILYIKPNQ